MDKINFGEYKVAKNWNDVTLLQWQNYVRKASETEDNNVDIISTLEAFSDIPRNIIEQMPTDMFQSVTNRLKWLETEPNIEPTNKVVIDGEEYIINTMEKLRVKEYLDVNTVLENDKYNYATLFAILCRKRGEEYSDEYVSEVLDSRVIMFEKSSAVDMLGLIAFFLNLSITLKRHSQSSLAVEKLKSNLTELVKNIRNSLKLTDYITPSKLQRIMTLRRLEKSLSHI